MNSETKSAWLDVLGLLLPLVGAWLLFLVAVPDIVFSPITDATGAALTDGEGMPLSAGEDRTSLLHYYLWAVPAMILVSAGTALQARQALATLYRASHTARRRDSASP